MNRAERAAVEAEFARRLAEEVLLVETGIDRHERETVRSWLLSRADAVEAVERDRAADAEPRPSLDIDEVAERLTAAGDEWRTALPPGVRIVHDGDATFRDAVCFGDKTAYRVEVTGRWYSVGWSYASKRQVYRPGPLNEEQHFRSLHSDDDGE